MIFLCLHKIFEAKASGILATFHVICDVKIYELNVVE